MPSKAQQHFMSLVFETPACSPRASNCHISACASTWAMQASTLKLIEQLRWHISSLKPCTHCPSVGKGALLNVGTSGIYPCRPRSSSRSLRPGTPGASSRQSARQRTCATGAPSRRPRHTAARPPLRPPTRTPAGPPQRPRPSAPACSRAWRRAPPSPPMSRPSVRVPSEPRTVVMRMLSESCTARYDAMDSLLIASEGSRASCWSADCGGVGFLMSTRISFVAT